jgi:hypothetical protein
LRFTASSFPLQRLIMPETLLQNGTKKAGPTTIMWMVRRIRQFYLVVARRGSCQIRLTQLCKPRVVQQLNDSSIISAMPIPAETPAMVIRGAIDMFAFNAFLADAIWDGRIIPSSFREQAKIDIGAQGLVFRRTFSTNDLQSFGKINLLMALGATAIATDNALDAVFSKANKHQDITELGAARAIMLQIRCAFAHDPFNPVWKPDVDRYKHQYHIVVKVPRESGDIELRIIKFHPPSVRGKHLSALDFGGLGGYMGLLQFCLEQVEKHPLGNKPYVVPLEA